MSSICLVSLTCTSQTLSDRSGNVLDELVAQSIKDARQDVDTSKDYSDSSKCALCQSCLSRVTKFFGNKPCVLATEAAVRCVYLPVTSYLT